MLPDGMTKLSVVRSASSSDAGEAPESDSEPLVGAERVTESPVVPGSMVSSPSRHDASVRSATSAGITRRAVVDIRIVTMAGYATEMLHATTPDEVSGGRAFSPSVSGRFNKEEALAIGEG